MIYMLIGAIVFPLLLSASLEHQRSKRIEHQSKLLSADLNPSERNQALVRRFELAQIRTALLVLLLSLLALVLRLSQ